MQSFGYQDAVYSLIMAITVSSTSLLKIAGLFPFCRLLVSYVNSALLSKALQPLCTKGWSAFDKITKTGE